MMAIKLLKIFLIFLKVESTEFEEQENESRMTLQFLAEPLDGWSCHQLSWEGYREIRLVEREYRWEALF